MIPMIARLTRLEKELAELKTQHNRTGLFLGKSREVTIAAGSATVVGNYLWLIPESGNSDDLTTLVDDIDAKVVFLRCADAAYTITIKDGTGNILLPSGDVTLAGITQVIPLIKDEAQSAWITLLPVP